MSKNTKEKILKSAKNEFLEKGFLKASLRNICRNADVTTGALYFFFKDKDDLFCELSRELRDKLFALMQGHFEIEDVLSADDITKKIDSMDSDDDIDAAVQITKLLYKYRDETILLFTKAQGSSLENLEDIIIQMTETQLKKIANISSEASNTINEYFIHWIAHMEIDAFKYMILHIENEEEGLKYIVQAVNYMVKGWFCLFNK